MMGRKLAVVFGGAGFIGRHLVPRLARDGYECRIVTRNPEAVRPLSTQGRLGQVVPWTADLRSDAALARALGRGRAVDWAGRQAPFLTAELMG